MEPLIRNFWMMTQTGVLEGFVKVIGTEPSALSELRLTLGTLATNEAVW